MYAGRNTSYTRYSCVGGCILASGLGVLKDHYLSVDRIEAGFVDHICKQKFRRGFMKTHRHDSLNPEAWPTSDGLEALYYWHMVR